jgi:hypothetical protein
VSISSSSRGEDEDVVVERGEAVHHGTLAQVFLSDIVLVGLEDGLHQELVFDRLEQEAEDVAPVHGVDRHLQVGVPGEHNPHACGS